MRIHTSIYMHRSIEEKLNRASVMMGISRTQIIHMLLRKFIGDCEKQIKFFSGVKYQERHDRSEWIMFHLSLWGGMYEYCMDLRKICKMSLSLIVAYAVRKYLKRLIAKFDINTFDYTDNFEFNCYVASSQMIDGVQCWKFLWGILPENSKFYQTGACLH